MRRAMSAVSVALAKRRLAEFNNTIFHQNHIDGNDGGVIRSQIDGFLSNRISQLVSDILEHEIHRLYVQMGTVAGAHDVSQVCSGG